MRSYHPTLAEGPRIAALVQAIEADIRGGVLAPGEALPGSRTLAARLGVSRGTVVQAFRELVAEGWLDARPGSGVWVQQSLPSPLITAPTSPIGFPLPPAPAPPRLLRVPPGTELAMVGGLPDLRLLPLQDLARAYGRVLRGRGRRLVSYGSPFGEDRLRMALAAWLAETRGLRPDPERVLVTRGSQMALYLVGQALLRPGDRVGVERLGYPPAWRALAATGAELVPLEVDEDGLVVEGLPKLRALYLTPHHQYPTGALLPAARRLRLLAWAAEHQVAVIEDDYDHEFHYEGPPVRPLASMDAHGVVVHIGTLSKAFAPGLRLGWVVAPPVLVERLAGLRAVIDRQGDRVVEHAVAELLEDGTLVRHLRRVRRVYAERWAHLHAELPRLLPDLTVTRRPGGLAAWAQADDDPVPWAERARRSGVFFEVGAAYTFSGAAPNAIRLGFASLTPDELTRALTLVARSRGPIP